MSSSPAITSVGTRICSIGAARSCATEASSVFWYEASWMRDDAVEQLVVGGAAARLLPSSRRRVWGVRVRRSVTKRFTLSGRQRVEARVGADQDERLHALGRAQRDVARDAPAHRQPDEVQLPRLEVLGDAQHVAGEVLELQRAFVVVGVAVAARVPGGGLEAAARRTRPGRPSCGGCRGCRAGRAPARRCRRPRPRARGAGSTKTVSRSIRPLLPRFSPRARGFRCPS